MYVFLRFVMQYFRKRKTNFIQNISSLTTRWQLWRCPSWTNRWWPPPSPWCWTRKTWCHFWWSTPGPGQLSLPASRRTQTYNTETCVYEKILHVNLPALLLVLFIFSRTQPARSHLTITNQQVYTSFLNSTYMYLYDNLQSMRCTELSTSYIYVYWTIYIHSDHYIET